MKLLAVGDSFTYGEELEDRNQAWPYLVGKNIGYTVTNLGKPASGNTYMIRSVVSNIHNYDLFIIAWSHFARMEFADQNGAFDIWPGSNLDVHHGKLDYRQQLAKYITAYNNDTYLYYQYVVGILLLQNFLKNNNKRYIMVNAFGNEWTAKYANVESINQLAKDVDEKYFLGWPDLQMVEWTYGCPQGPTGHFLDEGHQRVADKINEHIRNLGWLS